MLTVGIIVLAIIVFFALKILERLQDPSQDVHDWKYYCFRNSSDDEHNHEED
jgi:hypothetical protein